MNTRWISKLAAARKPLLGAAGLVALVVWSAGGCGQNVAPGVAPAPLGDPLPPGAVTLRVARVRAPGWVEVPATVESESKATLSAKVPAHVREVLVGAGAVVREGQELIRLDDREIAEQVAAAEAQLRQAEAEYRRTKGLFDSNAATEQQLLAAETAREAARAQLERAKVMLSYTRIISPMDGVVTDRRVEPGDLASPGMPLLAVYDPRRMRVEAAVPMRLVERLSVGQEVEVEFAQPAVCRRGTVSEIVSEVDPATRTQRVKVRLAESEGLKPGAFARLIVPTEPLERIRVPAGAVERVGQLEYVRVVRGDRMVRRLVRTGVGRDGQIEVLSGLDDGDVVVLLRAEG
ncbi:MAG: efflux RND transporter periplasmic adaptor subunit [Kiritimatiellae bacterium]|nr:efflux RND transporter periplasmic adaptor subunit [Kiritimatiellia bacterium]